MQRESPVVRIAFQRRRPPTAPAPAVPLRIAHACVRRAVALAVSTLIRMRGARARSRSDASVRFHIPFCRQPCPEFPRAPAPRPSAQAASLFMITIVFKYFVHS